MQSLSTLRAGLVAALLFTSAAVSAQGTWQSLDTGSTQDLNAVHFVNASVGYAVGTAGTVVKTTDGGATWDDVSPAGLADDLQGVYFFDASEGLVVGGGATIRRTTDGGASWTSVSSPASALFDVSFSGDVGIISAGQMTILRSTDRGASWTEVQGGFFGFPYFGAHMLDGTHAFVAGQNAVFQPIVGFSDDGGQNWDFSTFYLNGNEGQPQDVRFVDPQNGFTVSTVWDGQGAISRSQDGGETWTHTLVPSPLYGLDFASAEAGLAVGDGGAVFLTADGGQTWSPETTGSAVNLGGVSFPSPSVAYAAGTGGTVLKGTFGPSAPLTLAVTPLNPPVSVAPGGAFQFTVQAANTGDEAVTFDLWAEGTRDGGGPSVTRGPLSFTLPAGVSRQVTVTQRVPQATPSGAYTFTVFAGDFPGDVFASDGFAVTVTGTEAASATASAQPARFALEQNAPNPFNGRSVIRYSLPEGTHVTLRVYDALGKEVAVLVDAEQAPGQHEVAFDAADLPAGVYLYRLVAGSAEASKTMMLAK